MQENQHVTWTILEPRYRCVQTHRVKNGEVLVYDRLQPRRVRPLPHPLGVAVRGSFGRGVREALRQVGELRGGTHVGVRKPDDGLGTLRTE